MKNYSSIVKYKEQNNTTSNFDLFHRYTLLAWSHMSSFFLVVPAHCSFQILFQGGMIFYIVPMIVITINDICAYYVGFLMGKTPLIKVCYSYFYIFSFD